MRAFTGIFGENLVELPSASVGLLAQRRNALLLHLGGERLAPLMKTSRGKGRNNLCNFPGSVIARRLRRASSRTTASSDIR